MTPFPAPNRLHVWWARRPLVASRAAVLASLLPADADRDRFLHVLGIHGDPVAAKKRIAAANRTGERLGADAYGYSRAFGYTPEDTDRDWLAENLASGAIVLDPTAGGGSIPFESIRVGLHTVANDLNPVAALLERATVEWPSKFGGSLKAVVEELGDRLTGMVRERLAGVFPEEPGDHTRPDGYLWARTVTCPYCDGLVPLSPNWRLAPDGTGVRLKPRVDAGAGGEGGKPARAAAGRAGGDSGLRPQDDDDDAGRRPAHPGTPAQPGTPAHRGRVCGFEIVGSAGEQSPGTVARGDGTCPFPDCGRVIDGDAIKEQAQAGRMGEQLFAVVYKERVEVRTKTGRIREKWVRGYRAPRPEDDNGAAIRERLAEKLPEWEAFDLVPSERFPETSNDDRPIQYGMPLWRDLFSPRQLLCHGTSVEIFREMLEADRAACRLDEARKAAYGYLALSLDKLRDYNSRMTRWHVNREVMVNTFDRHDFSFKWSYAEMAPLVTGLGYDWAIGQTAKCIGELVALVRPNDPAAGNGDLFDGIDRDSPGDTGRPGDTSRTGQTGGTGHTRRTNHNDGGDRAGHAEDGNGPFQRKNPEGANRTGRAAGAERAEHTGPTGQGSRAPVHGRLDSGALRTEPATRSDPAIRTDRVTRADHVGPTGATTVRAGSIDQAGSAARIGHAGPTDHASPTGHASHPAPIDPGGDEASSPDPPPITITCKPGDSLDHLGDASIDIVVMDPPYYDNVMYAELSDFFYVWLKRTAGHVFPELFRRQLTDKENEAVANPAKFRGEKGARALAGQDYRERMAAIFAECRRVLKPDGIMTLMFTHKATGAWDALTKGLIESGFVITASWPINTEAEGSLHIKDKAAANSTIFLVCRPRTPGRSDSAGPVEPGEAGREGAGRASERMNPADAPSDRGGRSSAGLDRDADRTPLQIREESGSDGHEPVRDAAAAPGRFAPARTPPGRSGSGGPTEAVPDARSGFPGEAAAHAPLQVQEEPGTYGYGLAEDTPALYWEDVEPRVARAVRARVGAFQDAGIAGVDLFLASFGPALEEFSRHWPLRRGTPREPPEERRRRRQPVLLEDEWDPYATTPEDALGVARREVKRWRLEKLTHLKANADLDPATAFFVLAWDTFRAPAFSCDEALRLAHAIGVGLDGDVVGRLAEKKGSDLRLWDSARRAAKGALGPADGSRAMIDAIHRAAHVARTRSLQAARERLAEARADRDPRFFAALEAVLEVLPISRAFTGIDVQGEAAAAGDDFEALYNLARLAYRDEIGEPEQLKLWRDGGG